MVVSSSKKSLFGGWWGQNAAKKSAGSQKRENEKPFARHCSDQTRYNVIISASQKKNQNKPCLRSLTGSLTIRLYDCTLIKLCPYSLLCSSALHKPFTRYKIPLRPFHG